MDVLHVSYNRIIAGPGEILATIPPFLGRQLDLTRMLQVVDRTLYRQRGV